MRARKAKSRSWERKTMLVGVRNTSFAQAHLIHKPIAGIGDSLKAVEAKLKEIEKV